MIHELRTYVVPDGRMPELLALFENILFGIFDRSNIKVVEFWTKRDVNELVYVCEFENEEAKKSAWDAFKANANSSYAFRKLAMILLRTGRSGELTEAMDLFTEYKINASDPFLQQLRGSRGAPPPTPRGQVGM